MSWLMVLVLKLKTAIRIFTCKIAHLMLVNIPVNRQVVHSVRAGNYLRMCLVWNPLDLMQNHSMRRSYLVDSFQWFSMDRVRPFFTNTQMLAIFDTCATLLACVWTLTRHHNRANVWNRFRWTFSKNLSNMAQCSHTWPTAAYRLTDAEANFVVWSFNILLNHYDCAQRHQFLEFTYLRNQ